MVNAFKEIRLSNAFINATGGDLKVNNEYVVYRGQTGSIGTMVQNASGVLSDRLYQTGVDIISLINASAGGVSSLNNASGILSLTGRGNVTVISGGVGLIYVSGDTSSLATLINLEQTGISLKNSINLVSGNLITTGQTLDTKINSLSGQINTALINSGNNLYNYLNVFSGNQQSFSTGMTTGFDNYRVDFPLGAFTKIPRVFPSVEVSGNILYNVNITGRSVSNFYALFSDVISESGVVLHVFATINS